MRPRARQPLLVVLALLAPVLLVVGIWLGGHPGTLPGFIRSALVDKSTRTLDDALGQVHDDYYRPVGSPALVNAALTGAVASLHDPFSSYYGPREYQLFQELTNSQVSGIGIKAAEEPRGVRVVEVYDGSPAQRARLKAGDLIVAVNGRRLTGVARGHRADLIRGVPGSDVRLTIDSGGRTRTETLTRATVSVPVVASRMVRTPAGTKVALVSLEEFAPGAHGEVADAVDRLRRRGAKAVVLDLQQNGGGLVSEARLVASIFIPEGTIVSLRGRATETETLDAAGGAIPSDVPVAVLVDHGTASAAEIVAGALQDHGRATLVGTATFGKGVFQNVTTLPNGGALRLTVGEYFTPKGRNLGGGGVREGRGIQPDVVARSGRGVAPRDRPLPVALRLLQGKLRGK